MIATDPRCESEEGDVNDHTSYVDSDGHHDVNDVKGKVM